MRQSAQWSGVLEDLSYPALEELARRMLRRDQAARWLTSVDLVHSALLKLGAGPGCVGWYDRQHLVRLVQRAMRQVLCAEGRRAKRLGAAVLAIDDSALSDPGQPHDVDLLDGLAALRLTRPKQGMLAELCLTFGKCPTEMAACLGISAPTARRWWRDAAAFLRRRAGD